MGPTHRDHRADARQANNTDDQIETRPVAIARWWHCGTRTCERHQQKKKEKRRTQQVEQSPGQREMKGSGEPPRRLSGRNSHTLEACGAISPPLSGTLAVDGADLVFLLFLIVDVVLLLACDQGGATGGSRRAGVRQVRRKGLQVHGVRRERQHNAGRKRTDDHGSHRRSSDDWSHDWSHALGGGGDWDSRPGNWHEVPVWISAIHQLQPVVDVRVLREDVVEDE